MVKASPESRYGAQESVATKATAEQEAFIQRLKEFRIQNTQICGNACCPSVIDFVKFSGAYPET